jgi:ABC-type sugar transport system ATPase subunit
MTEAKLLRLVADLRHEDIVLAGIAHELDEAADLRQQIQTIKDARTQRTLEAEALDAHGNIAGTWSEHIDVGQTQRWPASSPYCHAAAAILRSQSAASRVD